MVAGKPPVANARKNTPNANSNDALRVAPNDWLADQQPLYYQRPRYFCFGGEVAPFFFRNSARSVKLFSSA